MSSVRSSARNDRSSGSSSLSAGEPGPPSPVNVYAGGKKLYNKCIMNDACNSNAVVTEPGAMVCDALTVSAVVDSESSI